MLRHTLTQVVEVLAILSSQSGLGSQPGEGGEGRTLNLEARGSSFAVTITYIALLALRLVAPRRLACRTVL